MVLVAVAAALWSFGNALEIASVGLEDKLFWANVEYLGITTVPVFWFALAARYASLGNKPTGRQIALMLIVPAITNVLVWTNDAHGLMRQNVRLDANGPYAIVAKTYGPWLWVHVTYMYVTLAASSAIFVRLALRAPRVYRGQAASLLTAILLPWVSNVVYLFGQGTLRVDPTPIAFSVSSMAVAWGLLRYALLDVVPAARDAVIASMSDGVLVIDAQGRIVDLNPTAQRIIGFTERQTVGQHYARVLADEADLVTHLSAGLEARAEVTLGATDDATAYDLSVSPLYDGQGRLAGRVVTLRDITQRKQLEEQLRRSQKMEAVGVLAGGIAHHFNNLLTVVNGYSEFVLRALEPASPLREDVEAILRAGTHAADLTRRLLVFSRFRKPHISAMDLNAAVSDLEGTLRVLAGPEIDLRVTLDANAGHIEADPTLIEQILENLVTNARDAMPAGGTLTISTGLATAEELRHIDGAPVAPGRYASLQVSDDGIGMSAEAQSHLFEPFFTTKAVGEGTGLGLATVYGIVQELGGSIAVDTGPGRGTTVRLCLPQVLPPATAHEAPAPVPAADGSQVVLVVEDEEAVRRFVAQALRHAGYTVLEASDGHEALAVAAAQEPKIDLVLTDLLMPLMDGAELVRRLQAGHPGLRALFMSGYPEESDETRALDQAIPYLAKPFTVEKIGAAVRRALAGETIAA